MNSFLPSLLTHSSNNGLADKQNLSHYQSAALLILFSSFSAQVVAQSDSDITELEEIIIEEEGEPEPSLPLGTGMSGKTLSTAPGSGGDPVRTLQTLPGLTFVDDQETLPAVRGSRPGDNYFQADFAPVNYLFHFDGLLSVFNADLVESFEIYQSSYGPEFTGVTGGVFDVTLREPKTDRIRTTLDVSIFQAGALIEGPITDTQSFYLAGRFSYLDLLLGDQLEEEDGVKIEQFPKYSDYQGKYVWKPSEENKLTLQFNGARDEAQINIAEDSKDIETDPIFAGRSSFNEQFHEQALVWNHQANERLEFKTMVSHGFSDSDGAFGGIGTFDVDYEEYAIKNRTTYTLNERHDINMGVQLTKGEADIDLALNLVPCSEFEPNCLLTGAERLTTQKKIKYSTTTAYIKDNWYVSDKLTLFPGLAFQADDVVDGQFIEPRFALEYGFSENTILSAGFGQYQQAPDFIEFDSVFGNPDIDYQNAVHAQVGIQRFLSNGWSVKSEAYYKSLKNLVTNDDELNYTNDGEGYAYGLDTLIRKDLTNKFSGWASISLSKAGRKDNRNGEEYVFEFDQPVNVSVVGNYKFNNKWALGAKLWAHSGAPFTPIIGANEDPSIPGFYRPVYGKLNSDRFPTYHRLDLRIDRTFKRRKDNTMSAYFELLNVLGTENAAEYDYNADYTEREIAPQLTGFFSLGFKATF